MAKQKEGYEPGRKLKSGLNPFLDSEIGDKSANRKGYNPFDDDNCGGMPAVEEIQQGASKQYGLGRDLESKVRDKPVSSRGIHDGLASRKDYNPFNDNISNFDSGEMPAAEQLQGEAPEKDTIDAGVLNHRTKEITNKVQKRETPPSPIQSVSLTQKLAVNSAVKSELVVPERHQSESAVRGSISLSWREASKLARQRRATLSASGTGLSTKRITAVEVAGMIDKLVESGSKMKYNKVGSDHSSPNTTGSRKLTDRTGYSTTSRDQRPSVRFKPLFFIPDDSGEKSSHLSSVSQTRRTRWSEVSSANIIQWKKFDWLIAPLHKWDTLAQTSKMTTSKPDEPVQIRYHKINDDSLDVLANTLLPQHELPVSIPTQVSECDKIKIMHLAKQYPNRQILVERQESGKWKGMAFSDLQQTAEQLACSLIHSKIKPCSAVILAGETSPSMICCLLGCAFAAYPAFIIDSIADLHPHTMKQFTKNGGVEVIICSRNEDAMKMVKYIDEYPKVKVIVNMKATSSSKQVASRTMVYSYEAWQQLGKSVSQTVFTSHKNKNLAPNKIALIKPQYFSISGSLKGRVVIPKFKDESNPKCIMVTHDNIVCGSRLVAGAIGLKNGKERWMTHLHWCQAVMGEILPALLLGVSLYVPPEQAVQTGKLFGFCREVKPTLFKTTTAIWKTLVDSLLQEEVEMKKHHKVPSALRTWGRNQGKTTGLHLQTGTYNSVNLANRLKFHAAEALVFARLRRQLGLDKAYNSQAGKLNATNNCPRLFRYCLGHEDLDDTTKDYLRSVNIPFLTWFWFEETGTVAIQRDRHSQGTQFNQALLLEGTSCLTEKRSKSGDDEVCFASRSIFAGYLGDEKATVAKLSPNGLYCKSGAHGACFQHLILLSKRLDEYIITSSGKYIEATSIENKFTTFFSSGVLHDCVLIGEGMDRLLLLVSFKTIQDTDTLNGTVVSWCRKIGSTATKTGDLTEYKDKAVRNEILVYIGKINEMLQNHEEIITGFVILPRLLEEGIEIEESTYKVKRHIVARVFQRYIKEAYDKMWKALM